MRILRGFTLVGFWLVLMCLKACAQEPQEVVLKGQGATFTGFEVHRMPQAPKVAESRPMKALLWPAVASGAIMAADAIQTCKHLATGHWIERGLPTQKCGVVVGLLGGQMMAFEAGAMLVPRMPWLNHHEKVGRWLSVGLALAPGAISGRAIWQTYTSRTIVLRGVR
jgi:hypothetical protein